MSKKTVYKSQAKAEAAKAKAVRFTEGQLGDPGRAAEIESQSLGDWLAETGRRIENPPQQEISAMARDSEDDLREENEQLREELELCEQALAEANSRLSQIFDLSSEEIDPEDFEESAGD